MFMRASQPNLDDRMNGTEVDARRGVVFGKVRGVHSEMPVERRQTPAMGMVDPQIPEQAGAAFHALHELVGKFEHFALRQTGDAQAFDRERNIVAICPGCSSWASDVKGSDAQKCCQCRRPFEAEQKQASVMHVGIRAHDSTLHVVRVVQRRLCGGLQRQSAPHLRFGVRILQQPVHLLRQSASARGRCRSGRRRLRPCRGIPGEAPAPRDAGPRRPWYRAERRRPTGTGRPGS